MHPMYCIFKEIFERRGEKEREISSAGAYSKSLCWPGMYCEQSPAPIQVPISVVGTEQQKPPSLPFRVCISVKLVKNTASAL